MIDQREVNRRLWCRTVGGVVELSGGSGPIANAVRRFRALSPRRQKRELRVLRDLLSALEAQRSVGPMTPKIRRLAEEDD